jgi:hypothetical protein
MSTSPPVDPPPPVLVGLSTLLDLITNIVTKVTRIAADKITITICFIYKYLLITDKNNIYLHMNEDKSTILEKVLNAFIKREYPEVKEFYVNCDEFNQYYVGANMLYADLLSLNEKEFKKKIDDISKFVLTGRDNLIRIYFYEKT